MYRDYRIADLHVRMDTFGRTLTQATPYLLVNTPPDTEPDVCIRSNPHRLLEQQPHLTLDTCEYLSTGGSFYGQLLLHDGLLIHSSAVVVDGFAYIFSAPCGTGKSTHTALWQTTLGADRAVILNDDKPALRRIDDTWYAYGTPWSGKTDQNRNLRARLGGVCILARGDVNTIEPLGGSAALFALLEQTVRPSDSIRRTRLLDLLGALLEDVPLWHMHCTPTPEAAVMAYRTMSHEATRRFH